MNPAVKNKKVESWWWTEVLVRDIRRHPWLFHHIGDDRCGIQIRDAGKVLDVEPEKNGKIRLLIEKSTGKRRWFTRKPTSKVFVSGNEPGEQSAKEWRTIQTASREVAYRLGKLNEGWSPAFGVNAPVFVFEDDTVRITASASDLTMEIERKENNNPVVYVSALGHIYRFHGEFYLISEHIRGLEAGTLV